MGDRGSFSIKQTLDGLSETRRSEINRNIQLLKDNMKYENYKYTVRDDSKLVYNYCSGQSGFSERDVMEEACIIQWISENSNYQQYTEQLIRSVAEGLKIKYNIKDWSLMYRIVRAYIPDIVKQDIVHMKGLPEMKKVMWADME